LSYIHGVPLLICIVTMLMCVQMASLVTKNRERAGDEISAKFRSWAFRTHSTNVHIQHKNSDVNKTPKYACK